ncbi:MAG TPA: transposase [Gemmatimonadaceae bacterium]
MARQPRYSSPGLPLHVVQRGNNRGRIFRTPDDYLFFRECLLSAKLKFDCQVHAYVFMPNHVHLLMSTNEPSDIARTMQVVGRRYVPRFNKRSGRTGSLWEGRYRATVVDSERYLFTCYRYIELNPVRAGLVAEAASYRWSSFAANALGQLDALVSPHEVYLALSQSSSRRQQAYRALFRSPLSDLELQLVRNATHKGWALGDDSFRARVSAKDRRANPLPPGPRKDRGQTPIFPKIGV